jgi:hypothetical protein
MLATLAYQYDATGVCVEMQLRYTMHVPHNGLMHKCTVKLSITSKWYDTLLAEKICIAQVVLWMTLHGSSDMYGT